MTTGWLSMPHAVLLVLACLMAAPAGGQPAGGGPAAQPTFHVWEYRVKGNTLLERAQVERTVYRHLGPDRTIADVEAARRDLELLYKNEGYPTVLVNLPEQDVSDGVVALEVVPGKVDRLRISNSRYFSLGRIRAGVPGLEEGEVPYFPQVQKELAALNRASGDRRIIPIFRPGRTPGAVEVELRVKDELPLHATFELNDRDTQSTSRLRASANFRYTNLWQRHHSLSLQAQVAPQDTDDSRVLSGTYVMPLKSGHLLALFGVRTDSDVAVAGDTTVIGDSTFLGGRYIIPFAPGDDYFHSLTLGAEYRDVETAIDVDGGGGVQAPIDYIKFNTAYRATKLIDRGEASFNVGADFGVRGLGNATGEFDRARFDARPNYIFLSLGADYLREVLGGRQFAFSASGQVASGPLENNETFSIGGQNSVRGYFQAQLQGDDGFQTSLELRSRSYASFFSDQLRSLRFLAFADSGYVRTRSPLPGQQRHQELHSTGLGMRLLGPRGLSVEFDWAWPLEDTEQVDDGDSRGHFRIEYEL